MKMGKKCNCDCMYCKPLTVYNGNDWNVYRYGTSKNRVIGMCQLKSKGVRGRLSLHMRNSETGCE